VNDQTLPDLTPRDEPLTLTVHAMPGQVAPEAKPPVAAGRWKMLAVLLVCVAPIVASYLSYYVLRPEGRRNFGDLIEPQRPAPALITRTLGGATGDLRSLKGQWLLVTVAGGACAAPCENNLYLQRQLRESLGKEKERLDRVWLVVDEAPVPPPLLPALSGASVLRVSAASLADWLQPQAGQALADHLYLVDPMGNWMMRFPPNLDAPSAAKAKRDLDRLLRASSGWDKEGRP
jgi:hypothetical protein